MKVLSDAIYTKFTALTGGNHNSFYTSVSGQMSREIADQAATEPYAVFRIISEVPFATFTEDYETIRVEFFIFTDDTSHSTCETIVEYLNSLYHWQSLTVTGYTFIHMKRINYRVIVDSDDNTISCSVDYEVYLSKN